MSGAKKMEDGFWHISWDDYKKTHKDFKGVEPDGSRGLLVYDNGTRLVTEGHGLIIDGAPKKKEKRI